MEKVLIWTAATLLLNFACVFLRAYASPRVSLTVPVTPVRVEGMLSLRCQIWDADDTYGITISRFIGGKTDIMALNGHIQPGVDERIFLAVRRLSEGGSVVHFLSIINVEREDEGVYYCNVFHASSMEMVKRDYTAVEVAFFPDDTFPMCSSSNEVIMEGHTLLLNCTTEDSNPTVNIHWRRTAYHNGEVLKTTQHIRDGFVYSELPLKLSMADNQAVYLCEISHPDFPDHVQSCHVGPLNVIADPSVTQDSSGGQYQPPERTIPVQTGGGGTHHTGGRDNGENTNAVSTIDGGNNPSSCKQVCRSYVSPGLSYWVIGTIAACGFAIFFLFIGILLAVKLNRRLKGGIPSSSHYHHPHAAQQACYNDDIYSELEIQSRRDHNRVYMTLAKIDNPAVNPMDQSVPNWKLEGNYTGTPMAVKP